MFGAIAPRYDLLNHLLSLNMDRRWRRLTVDRLLAGRGEAAGVYLDSCAGTLDLAAEMAGRTDFAGRVVACDFTYSMLAEGGAKRDGLPISSVCADALALPLPDASCAGATVGFGVRNLASLDDGLAELARVLRPGARLAILEFTTPSWQPFRGAYLFYFRRVLPAIGRMVSGHGSAYEYLPASVLAFPSPPELADRIRRAGFDDVRWERWSGGIVALHTAVRADQATATASRSPT
jgi:demethylmenaquinone methyltransferase/2-methoxy-6-polyprenyl-1,4-benzoquinol methylase